MLKVKLISKAEYLPFIKQQALGNFMQYPSWAEVKTEWGHDLLGWFSQDNQLVGCALVLYRKTPYLNRYLAYIPRGPIIDWDSRDLKQWFLPLFSYLKGKKVFSVKMDPPVLQAKWGTAGIKTYLEVIRDQGLKGKQLRDLPPDANFAGATQVQGQLNSVGWQKKPGDAGFSAVQPEYVYRLPLEGRSLDEVFAGFHTNWRRNVRKAERLGVKVRVGEEKDLPAFYELLKVTSDRDDFRVRNFSYFETMYKALQAEDPNRIRLYLAEDEEDLLAATLAVNSNSHTWYLYGASSNEKREKAPNHAIQWLMIQDAHTTGAHTYDFRGISATLDEEDHLFGLLRFKLGFGGEACEMIGAWDYPLQPLLHWAFELYMKRR
jgi:lipid II:glycine glycyltransferase (peptidoglycan interpeptide bridge formation enzyme)